MITIVDKKFNYAAVLDPVSGLSIRTNRFDSEGNDTGEDPFQAEFPELLDIGIMGHCAHGLSGRCRQSGVECYQSGWHLQEPNLTLEQYRRIIDECKGRTLQVALGGRGDPDMHEQFGEILAYSRENNVIPNFTTSGFGLREALLPVIKKYCGAVAVSWYRSEYTINAIEMLTSAGIKTNIHYCLNHDTLQEATRRLRESSFPKGVNRIIFLLHKPVGMGKKDNMLDYKNPDVKDFFSLFDREEYADIAGFDSCSVPALLTFTHRIHPSAMEPCEASRFSAYISPDFKLYPCSFEKKAEAGISLTHSSIEEAWNSAAFSDFRKRFVNRCRECSDYMQCLGGCPVLPEITICPKLYSEVMV